MTTMNRDEEYMRLALEEARKAYEEGEVPVGAVVVFNGRILAAAHNTREGCLDISGHAEINAMRQAEKALGRWTLEGCTLYVTLEPCVMCAGAIRQSRLSSIVYGAADEKEGAVSSAFHVFDGDNATQTIVSGVLAKECSAILKDFFEKRRGGR
ncbi:MAG: tRNA adenosine(34) deaminase TadA [Bacilli bacterium]|nr:tRNA adenosine(34) deaminase TadA [Bacilli bacterium]